MTLKTQSTSKSTTKSKNRSTPILHNRGTLPGTASYFWEWQLQGSCRGSDSAVFFHPEGERGRARAMREARAKAVCADCPVLNECREHALAVGEPYGIWGGMSESEREAILNPTSRSRRSVRRMAS